MGRAPCCEKVGLKRGRWTAEEDEILINYIKQNGDGSWRSLPKNAGLLRCGKSCRLRWINYLREDLKRGNFSREEEETIIKLHRSVGNKWSLIASKLAGRTDNEVKNYWNSHLSRKIYSFIRSSYVNGPHLLTSTIDMAKEMGNNNSNSKSNSTSSSSSSSSKRKGGRVSRAVAKKYNMNNIATSSRSTKLIRRIQEAATAADHEESRRGNDDDELNNNTNNNVVLDMVEKESFDDFMSCSGQPGKPPLKMDHHHPQVGPNNVVGEESDDDVSLQLLDQFLQDGGLMELMMISETNSPSSQRGHDHHDHHQETGLLNCMDLESYCTTTAAASVNYYDQTQTSGDHHDENVANSALSGELIYGCFSPLNSYFNNNNNDIIPDPLSWDAEFQLWDIEEDIDDDDHLVWPWEESPSPDQFFSNQKT